MLEELAWIENNTLKLNELKSKIRTQKVVCKAKSCNRLAIDVHHLDGNHSNNAPLNLAPACKICHTQEHDISANLTDLKMVVRELYAVQEDRLGIENRIRAYAAIEQELKYVEQSYQDLLALENKLQGYVKELLKDEPFYQSWMRNVHGIGPLLSARILSEMGSPDTFETPRQFWAYSGLHVVDGEAPRRRKGEKANWNSALRTSFYLCVTQFLKADKSLGKRLYDEYRQYYVDRDGENQPNYILHARASRRVMKDFSRCLLIAWRGQKGLWVSAPHPNTRVLPHHWINNSLDGIALPKADQTLIDFLLEYEKENGEMPLQKECAEPLGVTRTRISHMLNLLDDRGIIRKGRGWRDIEILVDPDEFV